uniref:Uncharacterized protein n=1 Tax=Cacopsylla melanoneura TaxID=428564 RepID=A0A8D8TBT6_9HEMI
MRREAMSHKTENKCGFVRSDRVVELNSLRRRYFFRSKRVVLGSKQDVCTQFRPIDETIELEIIRHSRDEFIEFDTKVKSVKVVVFCGAYLYIMSSLSNICRIENFTGIHADLSIIGK